ncbi:MAG: succinic semialdehyde dehydrogenase [Candidatus Nanopelagicales bacterium]|nr:succinic semialdehyde dehydrogenase [Candidatus Nanopelagicales bacterium]
MSTVVSQQSTLEPSLVRRLTRRVHGTSGEHLSINSPINRAHLADVPVSTVEDVNQAFRFARRAQRAWAESTVAHRASVLLRFHDLVLQHRDEGLDLVQQETGKARRDALEEILDVCIVARHYGRDGRRVLRPKRHRGVLPFVVGVREFHHPKGVIGVIAPWNYPLTLAITDALPALLAGNAVVLKPDSQTPLTALWALELLREAGLPDDVMSIVVGAGSKLGPAIVAESDYLMFTGSTRVGRVLAAACGERLIGCSMELGGKNALIVCDDADLPRAAEVAVRACFANAGQLCISIERMYIHRSVWDEFLSLFIPRVARMRLEVGVGWGADMGSLISEGQLRTVESHVDDATAKGASVLAGGKARPDLGPYAYEPTVLADVTADMTVYREETFGPVVSVYPFDTDDEVVAASNDTEYGLNGSVLTRSWKRGHDIAQRLRVGTVNINEGYAAAFGSNTSTMGGMGDSGMGRRHGDEGLLKYTESQTVANQRLLGLGAQFGLSDEQWGNALTVSIGIMKRLGLK